MQRYSLAKPYDPVGNIFYYGMHSGALNLRDDYAASSAENAVFSYSFPALFMRAYTADPFFLRRSHTIYAADDTGNPLRK